MKYLIKYKLFENVERRTLYDILKSIDTDEDTIKIFDLFDLDKKKYYLSEDDISVRDFKFYTNIKDLSDFMNIEDSILDDIERIFSRYNDFEYYVDRSEEMNYMSSYLNSESIDLISKLAKSFDYDLKLDKDSYEQKIVDFLKYIGVYDEISYEYIADLSNLKENALKDCLEDNVISKQPFILKDDINYGDDNKKQFYYFVKFEYDNLLKFLEENNIKDDVYTMSDLFEKIAELLPYNFYYEYEIDEYETSDDLDKISEKFINIVEKYWDNDDNEIDQKLYIKIVNVDNIQEIKNHIDDIYWINKDYETGKYIIEFAKKDSKCYEFFASNEFLDKMKEQYDEDEDFIEVLSQMNDERFGQEIGLF